MSGKEICRVSGGDDERWCGDRAVCQGSGHGGVPRDGYPRCFLHCVTGRAPFQANGGDYGDARWKDAGGRHFPCYPSF